MLDSPQFFMGIVDSIDQDADKLGRVKVRDILGHTNRVDTDQLFDATLLMPVTSASVGGIGTSPTWLQPGTRVLGVKFGDKNVYVFGTFGLDSPTTGHAVSAQAKGDAPVQKEYIEELGEKPTKYAAKYPYNKTVTTLSGHVIELDDTPSSERIHVYHKSGSYLEIFPDGSIVTKSMKDNTSVTVNDHAISVVRGDLQIVANEGKIQINADKDIDIVSKNGDIFIASENSNINVKSNDLVSIDCQTVDITGDVKVSGSITAIGEISANGKNLSTHIHSGVASGGSVTTPPV